MSNTEDKSATAPPAFSFPTASHPDEGEKVRPTANPQPGEDLLDEAISQSFPASDPVSVTVSPVPKDEAEKNGAQNRSGRQGGDHGGMPALNASAGFWAAALLSTAVVGVGAAWLLRRQRSTPQRLARLIPNDVWKPVQRAARSAHLPRGRWL